MASICFLLSGHVGRQPSGFAAHFCRNAATSAADFAASLAARCRRRAVAADALPDSTAPGLRWGEGRRRGGGAGAKRGGGSSLTKLPSGWREGAPGDHEIRRHQTHPEKGLPQKSSMSASK